MTPSLDRHMLDRLPPHNQAAERAVLGSLLRDNQAISKVVPILKKEDFYQDAHQKIYETILELDASGNQAVDLVTLAESMKLAGTLEDAGSYSYLAQVYDGSPSAANVEHYARIVRDKARVRNLIHVATEMLSSAYNQSMPAERLLEEAEKQVFALAQMGATSEAVPVSTTLDVVFDRIDARTTKGDMGLATGWQHVDELLCGLHAGEHIVVAARPGVGKTMFAVNLARHVGMQGARTLIISLEMAKEELTERLLVCEAMVSSQNVRKGTCTHEDVRRLSQAGEDIRGYQIQILDAPMQRPLTIGAAARRIMAAGGLDLLIVDYLQIVEPESRKSPRQEQVAAISRRMKQLARELKIPVISLAQINRGPEDRRDQKPRMSDIRESGAIEADADVVILLHRSADLKALSVIVEKQRNGPVGEIILEYEKRCGRLSHLETPFGGK